MLADILRLEEGCEKKTGKRSKDHVDVLHVEFQLGPCAKGCMVTCARAAVGVVLC